MLSEAQLAAFRAATDNLQNGPAKLALYALLDDAREIRSLLKDAHDRLDNVKHRVQIFHDAMKHQSKLSPFRQERIRKALSRPI